MQNDRRRGRIFPRRIGFYDTVFSQPVFWVLVAIVSAGVWVFQALGWI